jgi:hypothetical protein
VEIDLVDTVQEDTVQEGIALEDTAQEDIAQEDTGPEDVAPANSVQVDTDPANIVLADSAQEDTVQEDTACLVDSAYTAFAVYSTAALELASAVPSSSVAPFEPSSAPSTAWAAHRYSG